MAFLGAPGTLDDGVSETVITFPTGTATHEAGIFFGEPQNYYLATLSRLATGPELVLVPVVAGKKGKVLANTSISSISLNVGYFLRVHHSQRRIVVEYGEPGMAPSASIEYDSSTDLGQGRVGLYTDKTDVTFDHLYFDRADSVVSKRRHLSGTATMSTKDASPSPDILQINGQEGGRILLDNFSDDDYMIQFTSNLSGGDKNVVFFRYQDQNNHYRLDLSSTDVDWYEVVNGKPKLNASATITGTGDVSVKLKVAGISTKAWIGGVLKINKTFATFGYGGIGFTGDSGDFWSIKVGYDNNGDDDIDDAGDKLVYEDDLESTSLTVTYDDNGNLTNDGTFKYTYDAWNRLVKVTRSLDDSITIGTYKYDAAGRRIKKTVSNSGDLDGTTYFYYNNRWQLLESRDGTEKIDMRVIPGTQYVDEIVRFEKFGHGTMYVFQDANWNVTSTTSQAGDILERISTTPYGEPTFDTYTINGDYDGDGDLDGTDDSNLTTCKNGTQPATGACRVFDFDNDGDVDTGDESRFDVLYSGTGTDITRYVGGTQGRNGCVFAHQGLVLDNESHLILHRNRQYSVLGKRFLQRDPMHLSFLAGIGYGDGMSLYAYIQSSPANQLDPSGLYSDGLIQLLQWISNFSVSCCSDEIGSALWPFWDSATPGSNNGNSWAWMHCVIHCKIVEEPACGGEAVSHAVGVFTELEQVANCLINGTPSECESAWQASDWWDNELGRGCGTSSWYSCNACCAWRMGGHRVSHIPEGPGTSRPFGPLHPVSPGPISPPGGLPMPPGWGPEQGPGAAPPNWSLNFPF